MDAQTLAKELDRDPFIPLRLHLADGRTIDIHNPGLSFIARLGLYVFRVSSPPSSLAQDQEVVSIAHIVTVEQMPAARGGRRARRPK